MRILHGESSIAANWASRNLFPANGNNFAAYQLSSPAVTIMFPRSTDSDQGRHGNSFHMPQTSLRGSSKNHHRIAWEKVDSIAFYFLKTCVMSCACT
jgi:hypothetical protein